MSGEGIGPQHSPSVLTQVQHSLFFFNFIFGCTGSLLLCVGFLQLQRAGAALLLLSTDSRASVVVAHQLQSTGSIVVAHGLSCPMACRIFSDSTQGANSCLLYCQVDSLPLSHQGSPWHSLLIYLFAGPSSMNLFDKKISCFFFSF